LNFIHSYNVRVPGTQEDFILWMVDSRTTSHMFIQIPCHTTINGVGQAVCDTCVPLILHCIPEDDLTYFSIHDENVYYMTHMKFPILSTGKLESQGHEFHLCQSKSVMITTNKLKVPLIGDDVINFTWLTERPRARTTILIQE
jgi:hypothetical protein